MFLRVATARANVARALLAAGSAAGGFVYGQISTLAFVGIEARPVEVQVRITPGQTALVIVGLPDKAVAESRERVRNALHAVGLGMPYRHVTVNLAPADLPKEGSQFDLPIVLAMMVAMEAIAPDAVAGYAAIGELALDGSIRTVPGALPAAIGANAMGKGSSAPPPAGRRPPGPARTWTSSRRRTCSRSSITSRAHRRCPAPSPTPSVTQPRSPICATSRARKAPSACSRWPLPAGTTS
jgi:hypothetical protein